MSRITYTPAKETPPIAITPEQIKKLEPIQVPPNIPRFSINQGSENSTVKPENIIENKLNNVVKSINSQSTQEKPLEKYDTDPYREPIE